MTAKEFLKRKYPNIDFKDKTGIINGRFWKGIVNLLDDYHKQQMIDLGHCKVNDLFSFGDIVRAKCTALGRYIGNSKCVYISAMTNDRCIDDIDVIGDHTNKYNLPVIDDEELKKYKNYKVK